MDENFVHADVGIKKDKNMIFLFNTNKDEIIPVGNGSRVRNRCERLGCDGLGVGGCLLYTSPSPRDKPRSRMPSSA